MGLTGPDLRHEESLFEQTIPRRLVHRTAVTEVLITGFRADGPDRYLLGAQWPLCHRFYRTVHGRHDPFLLVESVRQAGLLIGHAGYGVPAGHAFVMDHLAFEIPADALACEPTHSDVVLSVTCRPTGRGGRAPKGLGYTMELHRGARHAGTARARARCISPAVLARLRAGQVRRCGQPFAAGPPVPAERVGKAHPEDVVLSATGEAEVWTLRCRPHPVLFDHPMDHVPGNLMIEAMLQATRCRHWPRQVGVRALSANFHRYADLDRPVTVRAADPIGDDEPTLVSLTQDGEHLADGLITPAALT
ncbi:hypothetical protein MF672_020615 [Actinomadura sp. ATCC 31491]|uniref:A-factor biosynthesis hotdog domain-containing protein n=1 Tax=Actinomadura luzonensis TaxID=2805427 RepID=A0ABT0FV17_9ACTN|nr:ScbA/BarX family gamma-butyrolactone biosynthesis protein [Actinomadura luzonensis]MCK2216184.1 hypothetical protein [Actinomadura luzonensis]